MTDEVARMVGAVLRLEAERVALTAEATRDLRKGRPLQPGALMRLDQELGVLLEGLERRGVAYPGHVLAGRYGLSGGEYALLHLALMPLHAPDLLASVQQALGGPDCRPRLVYGLAIIAPADDPEELIAELRQMPLLRERLVLLQPLDASEELELRPSPAVTELYGLVA